MLHSIQNYRKKDSKVLPRQLHVIIDSQLSMLLSPIILLNFWYLYVGIISKRLPFSLPLISVFKTSKQPTNKKSLSEHFFYCLYCFNLCIEEMISKWCRNIQKPPDVVLISSFCYPNGFFPSWMFEQGFLCQQEIWNIQKIHLSLCYLGRI